jgi:hypothetical protein
MDPFQATLVRVPPFGIAGTVVAFAQFIPSIV